MFFILKSINPTRKHKKLLSLDVNTVKQNSWTPDWRFLHTNIKEGSPPRRNTRKSLLFLVDDAGEENSPLGSAQGNIKNNPRGVIFNILLLAEARGFEPPVRLPAHTLSKRAP